jgi:hypothetical protein
MLIVKCSTVEFLFAFELQKVNRFISSILLAPMKCLRKTWDRKFVERSSCNSSNTGQTLKCEIIISFVIRCNAFSFIYRFDPRFADTISYRKPKLTSEERLTQIFVSIT